MAVADRVVDGLGPALIERGGPHLVALVTALVTELEATDALLDAEPGNVWARAFDLDDTPYPAWFGSAVGTPVPAGLLEEDQRTFIRDRTAWRRGTPEAMVAAVRSVLTGDRHVLLIERHGSPWALTVQVYESEAPAESVVRAAAETQKPVGIILDVVILTGATYAHMLSEHGPTYADWATEFPTYADAVAHTPEGA